MTGDPTLPGRAVDIVHAAAQRAGVDLWNFDLTLPRGGGEPELTVYPRSDIRTLAGALAVFAQLGVTHTDLQRSAGSGFARMVAVVPAIGATLQIVIDAPQSDPSPDPTALVAEVDAARAAAEASADAEPCERPQELAEMGESYCEHDHGACQDSDAWQAWDARRRAAAQTAGAR